MATINLTDNTTSQVSSSYADITTGPGKNQQIVTKLITGQVIIEGYLKKQGKYLMSNKNYYRVIGNVVLIASSPRKKIFTEKYDLNNYTVQLSQGDAKKFYLNPRDDSLKLKIVRFIAESVEERARWFKALQTITEESRERSESILP